MFKHPDRVNMLLSSPTGRRIPLFKVTWRLKYLYRFDDISPLQTPWEKLPT